VNSGKNGPSGPDHDPSGPNSPDQRPSRESLVRVLLVEQSNVETEYLQGLLSKAYFTTHHVTRVSLLSEALELLEEGRFDTLLIDLKQTVGPELEALQRIQSTADEIGLPIVVVTETEEESLALDSPGDGTPNYLIRGEFQSRTLIRSIQQAIDRQRMLNRIRWAEERELHLTTHDQLTGLPNRYLFADRLAQALHSSRRHRAWLGVLFMDLDRFRAVNETLGHSVGDQLLQVVARRLLDCMRATDTIARVSGDVFAVMLPALTKGLDAASVAQNIEDCLRPPFRLAGRELEITASIGIAIYPEDGNDADTLMNGAETALESAKSYGGNTRRFFTSDMNATSLRLLTLESDLRKAITREQDQLVIEYQPIVDGHSGQIQEAEALVRWNHPELGAVAPDEFIPVAESRGLIIPLGAWALRHVCQQIRRWQDDGHPPVPIAVNVSPAQFWRADFLGLIMQTLQDTGAASDRLQVEITERSAMPLRHARGRHGRGGPPCGATAPREDVHRRLRNRILVPERPAAAPPGHVEDRPQLRPGVHPGHRERCHRHRHHRARQEPGPARDRRGRRDRGATPLSSPARLLDHAGFPLLAPAAGGQVHAAAGERPHPAPRGGSGGPGRRDSRG